MTGLVSRSSGRRAAALAIALRAGLGSLFVVAGALKLRAPSEFANEIANYQLLPALSPYLGATLPATEIVVGFGLLALPWAWRRAAALAAVGLLGMFLVAVSLALLRGVNVDCGCFGIGGGPITGLTWVRDVALAVGAAALLAFDRP